MRGAERSPDARCLKHSPVPLPPVMGLPATPRYVSRERSCSGGHAWTLLQAPVAGSPLERNEQTHKNPKPGGKKERKVAL